MKIATLIDSDDVLIRTAHQDRISRTQFEPNTPFWGGDTLKWVGKMNKDYSAFNVLLPEALRSLRDHLISFAISGQYSAMKFITYENLLSMDFYLCILFAKF